MITFSVPAEIEEHAAIFRQLSYHESPHTPVTAIAVQAEEGQRVRVRRHSRRTDDLV
jgi:hypothetical protein